MIRVTEQGNVRGNVSWVGDGLSAISHLKGLQIVERLRTHGFVYCRVQMLLTEKGMTHKPTEDPLALDGEGQRQEALLA